MNEYPWHQHPLQMLDRNLRHRKSGKECKLCLFDIYYGSGSYYRCEGRCDYYVHGECYSLIQDFKAKRQVQHPLHPQHHLTFHFDCDDAIIPGKAEYDCSFCRQSCSPQFFLHCSSPSCDFYLCITCSIAFVHRQELLSKFETKYFHGHSHKYGHPLRFYYIKTKDCFNRCKLCRQKPSCTYNNYTFMFKCKKCRPFYLDLQCSLVPQKILEHCCHPQHPLTLLPYSKATTKSNVTLHCNACRCSINKNAYVLHCTECRNFNLDVKCAFLEPNMESDLHGHPLVHFEEIYLDDVLCSACKTPCEKDSFRCIPCNYNIHSPCTSLPIAVDNNELHVHPLALTFSFIKDKRGHYYCDICETKRDPNHGVYFCDECNFVAHIQCAIPEDHPSMLEGYFSQK